MYQESLAGGIENLLLVLKIMLPVSFVVMLLTYFQVLPAVSAVAPLFTRIGLPGDAALVFVTGIFTNIYTVIALLSNMDFTVREGILLAMMCLISIIIRWKLWYRRNRFCGLKMVLLRFYLCFIAAAVLNLILPEFAGRDDKSAAFCRLGIPRYFVQLAANQSVVVPESRGPDYRLMILQRLLEEFGVLKWIFASLLGPYAIVGFTPTGGFLWVVGNTLGLAYGSAVLMDYARKVN